LPAGRGRKFCAGGLQVHSVQRGRRDRAGRIFRDRAGRGTRRGLRSRPDFAGQDAPTRGALGQQLRALRAKSSYPQRGRDAIFCKNAAGKLRPTKARDDGREDIGEMVPLDTKPASSGRCRTGRPLLTLLAVGLWVTLPRMYAEAQSYPARTVKIIEN